MGHSKSPVDDLVDGLDAIGSIIDENLPHIKARLTDLEDTAGTNGRDIAEIRRILNDTDETYANIRKAVTHLDIKLEEIMSNMGALTRRIDQLQQSLLDMSVLMERGSGNEAELSDTVKILEDRLKRLEGRQA